MDYFHDDRGLALADSAAVLAEDHVVNVASDTGDAHVLYHFLSSLVDFSIPHDVQNSS